MFGKATPNKYLLMVFGRLTSMNGEEPTASYAPKKLPFIIKKRKHIDRK
jgi:hypothetical protein